jgi:hypothetical protein
MQAPQGQPFIAQSNQSNQSNQSSQSNQSNQSSQSSQSNQSVNFLNFHLTRICRKKNSQQPNLDVGNYVSPFLRVEFVPSSCGQIGVQRLTLIASQMLMCLDETINVF